MKETTGSANNHSLEIIPAEIELRERIERR